MDNQRGKLIYATFDGDVLRTSVRPKGLKTKCSFLLRVRNEDEKAKKVKLTFRHVLALEYTQNTCEQCQGSDLGGFYELFGQEEKVALLERNFQRRRELWLLPGDYQYDQEDPNDCLNYRGTLEPYEQEKRLKKCHLYLLQSSAGAYLVLAKGFQWKKKSLLPGR